MIWIYKQYKNIKEMKRSFVNDSNDTKECISGRIIHDRFPSCFITTLNWMNLLNARQCKRYIVRIIIIIQKPNLSPWYIKKCVNERYWTSDYYFNWVGCHDVTFKKHTHLDGTLTRNELSFTFLNFKIIKKALNETERLK